LAATSFVALAALMLSLPISGLLKLINWLSDLIRRKKKPQETIDPNRRIFLKTAAAAVPIITVGAAVKGVGMSFTDVNMETRTMRFPDLPAQLTGLRILQLSDLHLNHYITLSNLEEIVTEAATFKPDLVLVTGDVADDLTQLAEALRLIDGLKAPLGTFASLGNHEYFRGIREVRRIFDESPVPLLVNSGIPITHNNASIYLAAIDDPRSMGGEYPNFFEKCIDSSLQQAPQDSFTILMSHRPNALDVASERSIDLVLAGHTHGGQVGLFGRSAFEPLLPEAYLWGEYQKKNTTLYTTSGAGHWFPFRLGCPREVPVIELARA
jgi:predicted MPP superfamily phosphohydrolase